MRVLLCGLFACLLSAQAPGPQLPDIKYARRPPDQPLPFSHKQHAGTNRTPCKQCHPMPDPGDYMELPATSVCMGCHTAVKTDSPHIKALTAAHAESRKMEWKPVYKIPDYVFFNHKKHNALTGVNCESCHGPVKEREVLRREKEISMQACMDCHRQMQAKNDCRFCHDPR